MTTRQIVRRNYDRLARWYDLFVGFEERFTRIGLELLNARPGERVLEIGFGTGRALPELARRIGPTGLLAGVDLSAGMVRIAQKRMRAKGLERSATLIQGDGLRLPFVPNAFDAVFLSFLELFADIPAVLRECRRVLKPGGRIGVVALAKRDSPVRRLYEWAHRRWPTVLDCRPIEVSALIEAEGFHRQAFRAGSIGGLPVEIVVARAGPK